MMEQLKNASGIIVENPDRNSHASIVGLSLDIPVLIAVENATELLKSGTFVALDSEKGIVCSTR